MPHSILSFLPAIELRHVLTVITTGIIAYVGRARAIRLARFRSLKENAHRELRFFADRVNATKAPQGLLYVTDEAFRDVEFDFEAQDHHHARDAIKELRGEIDLQIGGADVDVKSYLIFHPQLRGFDNAAYLSWLKNGICARLTKKHDELVECITRIPANHIAIWIGPFGVRCARAIRQKTRTVMEFIELCVPISS